MQAYVRVLALVAADAVCISAAWAVSVLAYWALGASYDPSWYLGFWPVAPAFVMLNAAFGLYHGSCLYPGAPLSPVEEMRKIFLSSMVTHLVAVTVLVALFQTTRGYSRVVIAIAGVVAAVAAQPIRNLTRRALSAAGIGQIPVVLAGSGEVARRVAAIVADDPHFGFDVVGYFNGTREALPDPEMPRLPCLGSLKDIVAESRRRNVKILFACQDERLFRLQMRDFAAWFTYVEYLPTAGVFPVFGAKAVSFGGLGGLEMVNQARKRLLRLQKRVMDNALAVCAFAVALPLFVVVPVLIRLTSKGPAFYRQERLGRNGRPFRIWKFRSMYVDADERLGRMVAENPAVAAEWESSFKLRDDPRVTPLGRFLRRTSLDELPQLFNVFCGEMALIGPRPIVDDEVKYYGASYETFASVRPGITGLWQVSGRSDTGYERRVALDTYYVLNWSPWMDVWILLRTALAVLLMRGAR